MSFIKSKGFKYLKNLIIGVGAAVVLIGALYKIMSWPGADEMLQIGLYTEAGLFLMLGILGPDKDYYWEKMYPGLDTYGGRIDTPESKLGDLNLDLNTKGMETRLDNLITEMKNMGQNTNTMATSMSSLKALQEIDFTGTKEQIKKMGQFYSNLNEAMSNINESIEETRVYKEQLSSLNNNLGSLNKVYGNILGAMRFNG